MGLDGVNRDGYGDRRGDDGADHDRARENFGHAPPDRGRFATSWMIGAAPRTSGGEVPGAQSRKLVPLAGVVSVKTPPGMPAISNLPFSSLTAWATK